MEQFFPSQSSNLSLLRKITLSAIMLTLVLIFHFLEKFIPLNFGYLKLNFSLLFILPIFYLCGFKWGFLLVVLRFIFGWALGGYNILALISQLILLTYEMIAILALYFYSYLFRGKLLNKTLQLKYITILCLTILTTSLSATILNVLVFFPLFLALIGQQPFSLAWTIEQYNQSHYIFFLFIPNYWFGTSVVYLIGNMIKFSSIFILYWPLSKILRSFKNASLY